MTLQIALAVIFKQPWTHGPSETFEFCLILEWAVWKWLTRLNWVLVWGCL